MMTTEATESDLSGQVDVQTAEEALVHLDDTTLAVATTLAAEAGIDITKLLAGLVKKADEQLHVTWSPAAKGFVRHRCGKPNCAEESEAPADRRD